MIAKTSKEWDNRAIYFQYLNDVSKYPLLTRVEEKELLLRIAKGEKRALDKLVTANLKFVINIANLYKGQGLDVNELINEGNLGLIEAARRFDANQKIKFISYAVWWIRQSITRAISEKARMVRISAEKELVLRRFNRLGGRTKQVIGGGQVIDSESLVGCSRYNAKEIEKILQMGNRTVSLDTPVGEDGDSFMIDVIPSDGDATDAAVLENDGRMQLQGMLDVLTPQERKVIGLYYGIDADCEVNLLEIGRMIGLSKERVRQVKENALAKLRELGEMRELTSAA